MRWPFTQIAVPLILTLVSLSGCTLHQRLGEREIEATQTRQAMTRVQTAFEARTNNQVA